MPLPPLRLLVLDTETTGFVPKVHRVMEYACSLVEGGKVVKEVEHLLELPEDTEIPSAVQVLTRIYPEDLIDKPTFEQIMPEIAAMVTPDTVIVGQNIKFDLGMLRGEGWDLTEQPWIDTAMLASVVFPELASYSLGYASKALKLNHNPPHRALGDVRATVEFLEKCCDRLQELPAKDLGHLQALAEKGSEGYKRLFASLTSTATKTPSWLQKKKPASAATHPLEITLPEKGSVFLVEEPVDSSFISSVLAGLGKKTWCAVKNIEAALDRHPELSELTVVHPPEFVVSASSVDTLLAQDTFTADELTVAMKLYLYRPAVRSDIPVHGEEYAVFAGKIASSSDGPEYKSLLQKASQGSAVLSHQHLLELCDEGGHGVPEGVSVIIDDASMLEDTATSAYGWTCYIPSLRAAAQGNDLLTKCVDLIELWAERLRNDMDLRYLAPSDLGSREASELLTVIEHVLTQPISSQAQTALSHLRLILQEQNLAGRFAWVESMQDGSKAIKSVPEDIGKLLGARLYAATPTTLLIPPASQAALATILPDSITPVVVPSSLTSPTFSVAMPVGVTLESVLQAPEGKTIVLVPSKRSIEDIFVRHTERLEEAGVTLLCQGFSGGAGRMQAEFCVASAPAVMVMTPWMYEGMDLEPAMTDKLILQSMPFDHPSHPVISRRAQRFQNPFGQYSLPRLKNRLFRLLRTFSRHAKAGATFEILDDRLRVKAYGKEVVEYLESLFNAPSPVPVSTKKPAAKKKPAKGGEGQMALL